MSVTDDLEDELEAWVEAFLKAHSLDLLEDLSIPDRRFVVRSIPCNLRCWRVGEPVDTKPGEPCPECGKTVPLPTAWERLTTDDHSIG